MRKITFALIFLVSFSAFAKTGGCLAELGVPVSEKAYSDASRLKIPNEVMDALIQSSTEKFDKREACTTDEVMIFLEESDKPYLGYRMKMKRDDAGMAIVDRIHAADIWDQRQYFDKLAKCEGLKSIAAPLARPILNASQMEIPDYVQAKLRDKHDLKVESVLEAISYQHSDPQFLYEDRVGLRRHRMFATTQRGREIKIVLGFNPNTQQLSLISAY